MEGSGKMVVTAVGIHSQAGIIMQLLVQADQPNSESTPQASKATNGQAGQGQLA